MSAPLIRPLPAGALDIIGDVHGEIDALKSLICHLGYDTNGHHPNARHLVFVGDLCDRGPDSPQVLQYVQYLLNQGNTFAVLGNHEINLLAGDAKDGSGWYFQAQRECDRPRYQNYVLADDGDKTTITEFLNTLPVALERKDIRIIHAAWLPEKISAVRALGNTSVREAYLDFEAQVQHAIKSKPWYAQYLSERPLYEQYCRDAHRPMTHLPGICAYDLFCSEYNPLHTLICGSERRTEQPFYAAGRWRFTTRERWWRHYRENIPVVMGHYWRQWRTHHDRHALLFPEAGNRWLGWRRNVFCVDFSVGARWKTRLPNASKNNVFRLAALRFPEKVLIFDNGEMIMTQP